MSIRFSHLAFTIAGGAFFGVIGTFEMWKAAQTPLLTCLSVIAAGVLVRLARGLPFSASSFVDLEEARKIGKAMRQTVRALRALLVVVFVTMGLFAFLLPILTWVKVAGASLGLEEPTLTAGLSICLGALLSYVTVRVFAVVEGDVGLTDLQAKLLESAVSKAGAAAFDAASKKRSQKLENPPGYGAVLPEGAP